MILLGIETSCDETAAAVVRAKNKNSPPTLLSHTLATSLQIHAQTGGVIPENAAREQLRFIIPVITKAIEKAQITFDEIDAIGITFGPGLIGSLLIGVETAKTLAFFLEKPIIPVNHMVGHIYANWLTSTDIMFPAIALVVSGGHTDLLLCRNHGDFQLLGGTRDDAAGEAFDKIGRLLHIGYPAGPMIEKNAAKGDPERFHFPRPIIHEKNFEFSFSGLKTAIFRQTREMTEIDVQETNDICRGVQDAIIEVLVKKTLDAVAFYKTPSLLLSGGVSANTALRLAMTDAITQRGLQCSLYVPEKEFCTDNAAMIAAAALYNFNPKPWTQIQADPKLYFEESV